jgi:hypothetical protein
MQAISFVSCEVFDYNLNKPNIFTLSQAICGSDIVIIFQTHFAIPQ